jgi:hypothetical protein
LRLELGVRIRSGYRIGIELGSTTVRVSVNISLRVEVWVREKLLVSVSQLI